MNEQTPQIVASSPDARERSNFGSCLAIILRTTLAIVLGILLGLVIFYGVPNLYRRYVLPIEASISRVQDDQARQAAENQRLTQRLDDFQQRLFELELQNDASKQTLDEVQAMLTSLEDAQRSGSEMIETLQADSEARTTEVANSVADVQDLLEGLDGKLSQLESNISGTDQALEELTASLEDADTPVAALRRELRLVMAMELITRSRLFLAENNLGLAENDILSARNLLLDLHTLVPDYQVDALSAIVVSLDSSLENLPDRPVLAVENLEIAWRLLLNGLPDEVPLSPAEEPTSTTPTPTTTP